MSIKFLVLGGGVFWVFFGGGSADFIFMGARIFLTQTQVCKRVHKSAEGRKRALPRKNLDLEKVFSTIVSMHFLFTIGSFLLTP